MTSSALDIERVLRETFVEQAEHHPVLGSTSDRAKLCASGADCSLPLLIVADRQTAGRGRGTNRWWTGRHSLAFSLLLDAKAFGVDHSRSPLVALAAAVAVAESVRPRLDRHAVGLHWPNDVFAAGRKLAGVLVEVLGDGRAIVGIGLNTNSSLAEAPPELQQTATTLLELTGKPHDQTEILVDVLKRLESTLRWLPDAPQKIARRADELCLQTHRTLTICTARQSVTGRCAGIATDGALLLDTPDGRRKFHTGVLRR